MAKQIEKFAQVQVSLPAVLLDFVRRQAELKGHSISGAIRQIIAEAARNDPQYRLVCVTAQEHAEKMGLVPRTN